MLLHIDHWEHFSRSTSISHYRTLALTNKNVFRNTGTLPPLIPTNQQKAAAMCTITYTKPRGCVHGHVVTRVVEYHEELGIYCGDIRMVEELEWQRERGKGKERGVEVEQGRVHGRRRRHAQKPKPKPEHQRKYEERVDKLNAGCGEDGRMEEGQATEEHIQNTGLQTSQSPQREAEDHDRHLHTIEAPSLTSTSTPTSAAAVEVDDIETEGDDEVEECQDCMEIQMRRRRVEDILAC